MRKDSEGKGIATHQERAAEIRKINARMKKLKKKDGTLAGQLLSRKTALVAAMQEACGHPEAVETAGPPDDGTARLPCSINREPMRICAKCGLTERPAPMQGYVRLATATLLAHTEYLAAQDKILKRLGISL